MLRKPDPARMGTVLYVTAEVLRTVAILAQPFVPTAAAKLLDLLAVAPGGAPDRADRPGACASARRQAHPKPEPIFPRYVEAEAKLKLPHPRSRGGRCATEEEYT